MKPDLKLALLFVWTLCVCTSVSAQFSEVAKKQGIEHVHYTTQLMGGGVCLFDFNNDDLLDIYWTGGSEPDQLYLNEGNGRFVDISESSGIKDLSFDYETFGVIAGDINNDGCRDLFVTVFSPDQPNRIFLNNCDSTFTDISEDAGITHSATSTSATFLDYNKDGFLDVYVINYIEENGAIYDNDGNVIGFDHKCFPNYMYINNGDNTFIEVAESFGLNDIGCGLAVVGTDFDQDGDQDIYIANDFGEWIQPNVLYRNNYPEDSFTDVSKESGMDIGLYAMGIAIGDYDRDDDFDYYITNLGKNYFMQNNGDGTFTDVSDDLNVENTRGLGGKFTTGWGTFFFDHNNDAYIDLFVSNGYIPAASFIATTIADENVMYENNNFNFVDRAPELGLNSQRINRGVSYGDFDNDGDSDILLPCLANRKTEEESDINALFYENNQEINNNWLQVKLEGTVSNRDGLGSLIYLYADGETFIQETYSGGTHASQNMNIVHYGLAKFEKIDSLSISWQSGLVDVFYDLPINQKLYIREGDGVFEIMGCTDNTSSNYNPDATYSTGCYHQEAFGCTDTSALNFDPNATVDDGSCEYKEIPTHIKVNMDDLGISIKPIPTRDNLTIEFKKEYSTCELKFYDQFGRLIISETHKNAPSITVASSRLKNGIYIVNFVMNKSQVFSTKIVKL